MNKNFLGHDGFIWFVGVVEDRHDPKYAGRLRVRCLGYHTQDKLTLPTADLPWAHCVLPTTSSGITGLGQSPSFLVEGSWCVGFFRDGSFAQEPVVLGSLPGFPAELADSKKGFNDPSGTYPKYKAESDVNRLAVNLKDEKGVESNPHLSLVIRRNTRITGIATADFDATSAADASAMAASDGTLWDQPEIPYAAVYPKNHTYESESGHIQEFDDTPNAERYYLSHRTGTSTEIDKDGNRVTLIKGTDHTLTSIDNLVSITGKSDISIGGRHKIYINKDGASNNNYDIQVGPNANINVQVDKGAINLVTLDGKVNVNSAGDYNVKVGGNYTMTVAGNRLVTVDGTTVDNTTGTVQHRGSKIDLN